MMNRETMTQDEALELMRKITAALVDLANVVAAALEPIVKAVVALMKALRPHICLWRNETTARWRALLQALGYDPDPPRSWAEAKRIWRRHGR